MWGRSDPRVIAASLFRYRFLQDAYYTGDYLKIRFESIALVSALICMALALVWSLAPQLLLSLWAVDFSEPVALMCRRAAALFAGIGVMLFQVRHAAPSPVRSAVAAGFIVACILLASLGVTELVPGHAGPGILLAVAVEITLALAFWIAN